MTSPQWRLVHAELDAGVELEVAHGRQAEGSWHGGRHEAWVRVRDAGAGVGASVPSFGVGHRGGDDARCGAGTSVPSRKSGRPESIQYIRAH